MNPLLTVGELEYPAQQDIPAVAGHPYSQKVVQCGTYTTSDGTIHLTCVFCDQLVVSITYFETLEFLHRLTLVSECMVVMKSIINM